MHGFADGDGGGLQGAEGGVAQGEIVGEARFAVGGGDFPGDGGDDLGEGGGVGSSFNTVYQSAFCCRWPARLTGRSMPPPTPPPPPPP